MLFYMEKEVIKTERKDEEEATSCYKRRTKN
jgi:hypothetical protein